MSAASGIMPLPTTVRQDLVYANHILAHLGVLDGFGHVSARVPGNTDQFMMARNMAPALITDGDILTLGLDGNPVDGDPRATYKERFIHSEIFRRRPDIEAIVHSHALSVLPYAVVPTARLRPVYHMAAGLGARVPVFEIRECECAGVDSDMLVSNAPLGAALANVLGDASVVLMRGHGMTVAAATVREATFIAASTEANARIQTAAQTLGPIVYLSEGEVKAAWAVNRTQINRSWDAWLRELRRDRDL